MAEKKANTDARVRSWATVVYPESMPEDFWQQIGELKSPVLVSPLHDQDVNPTGEAKKAHYHVLFHFENKKSRTQMQEIIAPLGGVGLETVTSLRGYARYLCHLDNPEKAQYRAEDVRAFGGIDYPSTIGLPTDRYKIIGEMMDFIDDQGISSYARLCKYARTNRFDWFRILCDSGTYVIKEYVKSQTWEEQQR